MHVEFWKIGEVAQHVDYKEGWVAEGNVELVRERDGVHARSRYIWQYAGEKIQLKSSIVQFK